MGGRRCRVVLGLILLGGLLPRVACPQTVPGFTVSPYATVTDPILMSFDPNGILFAGRDNTGSGGTNFDAVKIQRVGIGGTPVADYGNSAIPDPDAVLFDAVGTISGVAGSVLVGGRFDAAAAQGQVSAIRPDQSVVTLFGPTATFRKPSDLIFDHTGRLLFADAGAADQVSNVFMSTGGAPTILFTPNQPVRRIAVDATDRVFSSGVDGVIRIHDSAGVLVNDAFATGLGFSPSLAFGPGGGFGTQLYVLSAANGDLIRIDALGTPTTIGTGFFASDSIAFGPDGALYVAQFSVDQILRIVPATTTTSTTSTITTTTSTSTSSTSNTSVSTSSTTSTSDTVPTTTSTTLPPVCTGGTTISHATLVIAKVGAPPGDERLTLAGRIDFQLGIPHTFDPTASGAQLLLEDLSGNGTVLLDLTFRTNPIPPGVAGTGCGLRDGWKGTRYKNASNRLGSPTCAPGSAGGLTLMRFRDQRAKAKGISFAVKTKGSTLPASTGPLRVTLVVGATADAGLAGDCGVVTFTSDRCKVKRGTLRCR